MLVGLADGVRDDGVLGGGVWLAVGAEDGGA